MTIGPMLVSRLPEVWEVIWAWIGQGRWVSGWIEAASQTNTSLYVQSWMPRTQKFQKGYRMESHWLFQTSEDYLWYQQDFGSLSYARSEERITEWGQGRGSNHAEMRRCQIPSAVQIQPQSMGNACPLKKESLTEGLLRVSVIPF